MDERSEKYIGFIEKRLSENILDVAKRLREMADEIEHRADFKNMNTPNRAVNTTIHTVNWGLANLNLDVLVAILGDIQEAKDAAQQIAEEQS